MAYLYDLGWRQGSLLRYPLVFSTIHANAAAHISTAQDTHGLWVVVTQDCDLAIADEIYDEAIIELRPIYQDAKSRPSGIRSRELLLMDRSSFFLRAQSPRAMVSPASLVAATRSSPLNLENPLREHEVTRLKTWVGKRYDRPAVPEELVPLARNIAAAVEMHGKDAIVPGIRDILWQAQISIPPRFSLYAVLADDTDAGQAREWLGKLAMEVPADIGIADEIEVATASGISLHLIETSYSADVSDITWRRGNPRGAY